MRIQLIDNDSALYEQLAIRLRSSGIDMCQSGVPERSSLNEWHSDADLFVIGQHPHAGSLAELSRQVWPKPVAALLPLSDTAHIMQVARDGAADAHPRSASLESIAQWLIALCEELAAQKKDKPVVHHFQHDGCALMATLQRNVKRAASTDSSVLIVGETRNSLRAKYTT